MINYYNGLVLDFCNEVVKGLPQKKAQIITYLINIYTSTYLLYFIKKRLLYMVIQ